jgi:hypothetical protein
MPETRALARILDEHTGLVVAVNLSPLVGVLDE